MNCTNCGVPVSDNARFCTNCGAPAPVLQSLDKPKPQPKKGIYIAIASVGALLLILLVIVAARLAATGMNGEAVSIYIDPLPSVANRRTITLSGMISSEKSAATLQINGKAVEIIMKDEIQKPWHAEVELQNGINRFTLTLTDRKGRTLSREVTVTYSDTSSAYVEIKFVKCVKAGIYVRPTPAVSDKYVLHITKDDYSTTLVYLNENQTDASGYVWYKVRTPNNGDGWVRSDIVTPIG